MAKPSRYGQCHICGDTGKLSFEHVPPESAFNSQPICTPDIHRVIESCDPDLLHELKGKISQRGAGGYTLCESCNNTTGHWYGAHYASWAYQAYSFVSRSKGHLSLAYPFHIFPLHIIKQIICMFFSTNSPSFREVQEELVRFVLNPQQKYLSPRTKIYAAYTNSNRSRQSGVTGMVSLGDGFSTASASRVFSEISFPPFTYVLCLDSDPPDRRLVDISFFAHYSFKEYAALNISLPVLPVYTWLPGDFRSRDEIQLHLGNVK